MRARAIYVGTRNNGLRAPEGRSGRVPVSVYVLARGDFRRRGGKCKCDMCVDGLRARDDHQARCTCSPGASLLGAGECVNGREGSVRGHHGRSVFELARGEFPTNPSRETKFSGANADREIFIFPVQLTTSRTGNLITRFYCYIFDFGIGLIVA